MKTQSVRARLMASTMIGGVALAAIAAAAPAFAQDQPPPPAAAEPAPPPAEPAPPPPAAAAPAPATAVQEVVVTGSRIRQPNLTTTSPVTTITSADVKLSGLQRAEDLVNQLPQAFADQGSSLSNGATGTANINLRGLGPKRTLVLVDGRRLMPGDPVNQVPDVNNVPTSLIDRIDVVTGGASAVYGSDAVAGVVNFIMRKNFEGVQIDVNRGFFQHNNNNDFVQGLERDAGFDAPSGSVIDGYTTDVTVTLGTSVPDGKGNIEAYARWQQNDAVLQGQRDYSACALGEVNPTDPNGVGTNFACTGSATSNPALFLANAGAPFTPIGGVTPPFTIPGPNGTVAPQPFSFDRSGALVPFSQLFNFAPLNFFQRPDTRYQLGTFAHYEVNRAFDAYLQAQYMNDTTSAQIAPSGVFGQPLNVNCDNPFLSAAMVNSLCTSIGLSDGDLAPVVIARRNTEGGGRIDNLTHDAFRIVVGARGAIDDNWNYDIYGQWGQTDLTHISLNDMSLRRIGESLDVVTDTRPGSATLGKPVCQSVIDGTDTNCVPWNIFQPGGVTQAALNFLQVPGFQTSINIEQIVSGSVDGKLGPWGVKSPWADDGVGIAAGFEYRRESQDFRTDAEFTTGDLAGVGGVRLGTQGAYDVKEIFTEARVPLISKHDWIEDLSLDAGYRHSHYSTAGDTDTYKVEGNWTPIHDIRFRASYNRAIRAPNVLELFAPQGVQLDGTQDPCAGPNPTAANPNATAANCARTGVTAGQFGAIIANPSHQYNGLLGGNPDLRPEVADTKTYGFVAQPRFLPGFNLTVDYFDIRVSNAIGIIGADVTIAQCLNTGDPFFCGLIHRDPTNGSLWLGTAGFITDTTLNLGGQHTKGLDFQWNYRWNLSTIGWEDGGHVDINFVGTYLLEFITNPVPGLGSYDCAGFYGVVCGVPAPKWKNKMRATWTTPWHGLQASFQWRYIGSVDVDTSIGSPLIPGAVDPVDASIGAQSYFDIAFNWRVRDNLTLRGGVNNFTDREPPLVGLGHISPVFGNGNTYPQVYDAMGRFVFLGLTANF